MASSLYQLIELIGKDKSDPQVVHLSQKFGNPNVVSDSTSEIRNFTAAGFSLQLFNGVVSSVSLKLNPGEHDEYRAYSNDLLYGILAQDTRSAIQEKLAIAPVQSHRIEGKLVRGWSDEFELDGVLYTFYFDDNGSFKVLRVKRQSDWEEIDNPRGTSLKLSAELTEVVNVLSAQSLEVLERAMLESRRRRLDFVGPEQLAIGALTGTNTELITYLRSKGFDTEGMTVVVENSLGYGTDDPGPQMPLNAEAREVLVQSRNLSRRSGTEIQPVHILLAIVLPEETSARMFRTSVDLVQLRIALSGIS